MKKSLVAMAALAATSAFAQSSVTLYGIVEATTDIAYKITRDTTTTVNTFNAVGVNTASTTSSTRSEQKNDFRIQDGSSQGTGSSRVGFRGTEDLGSGMKANFLLEMGLRVDDGCTTLGGVVGPFGTASSSANGVNCNNGGNSENSGGATFGRNAWGGLSGSFGEVRLGRQVLGSFSVQGNSGASGASNGLYDASTATLSPMGGIRFSNGIRYITPNVSGFTGSLMLSAPETAGDTSSSGSGATPAASAKRRTGVDLALDFANGPVYVGFGYNQRDGANSTANVVTTPTTTTSISGTPARIKGYTLGGSYDLGVVKPYINYTRQKTDSAITSTTVTTVLPATTVFTTNAGGSTQKALSIGLRAPVGAFTVITGYGRLKNNGNSVNVANDIVATNSKVDAFQLGAQYALSKRTLIETNIGYNKLRGDSTTTVAVAGGGRTETMARTNERTRAFNVGLKHSF